MSFIMKKVLSILLVTVMLLSMSVPAFAVDNRVLKYLPLTRQKRYRIIKRLLINLMKNTDIL